MEIDPLDCGCKSANTAAPPALNPSAKSWRDVLPVHPAADLFPMMSEPELLALGEDIKRNGMRVAVAVFKEQKHSPPVLLDGRNRLAAMEAANIDIRIESVGCDGDPRVELWFRLTDNDMWSPIEIVEVRGDHDDGNPFEYVVSANIHRRHLTNEEKDDLLKKLIKATPQLSNRQIGRKVGFSHPHVAKVRSELEKSGDVETVTTSTDTLGRQQPVRRHAETVGKDRKARPSKRKPTKFHRTRAAEGAAVSKPLPAKTAREAVAPDEELALLREFASFVIGRASVSTDPKDHIEWTMLFDRAKQVLGGAPLPPKADAPAGSAAAPPGDGLDIPGFLLRRRAP
jgi:hypothetical protein